MTSLARLGGRLLGLVLLALPLAAQAQTVSLNDAQYVGFSNEPIQVLAFTNDALMEPSGDGTLDWSISGECQGISFVGTPPTTPDPSGTTEAFIVGSMQTFCSQGLRVGWDANDDTVEDAFALADIIINANYMVTPISGAPPVVPHGTPLADLSFTVQVTDGGTPLEFVEVIWNVTPANGSPLSTGFCSGTYLTDANGMSTFPGADFQALVGESTVRFESLGTWQVTADINPFGCKDGGNAGRTKGKLPSANFFFDAEPLVLEFTTVPSDLAVGTSDNFLFVLRTTPSGVPVGGADVFFFVNPSGLTTPFDGNVNTAMDGTGSIALQADQTDIGGGATLTAEYFLPDETLYSDNTVFSITDYAFQLAATNPQGVVYTDEIGAGFSVVATANQGNTDDPVPGLPVTFTITSGNATFTTGDPTTAVVNTDGSGIATSPDILVGRTGNPVEISADAGTPYPSVLGSYDVLGSVYSLAVSGTPPTQIEESQTADFSVLLQRTGSGAPVTLDGETIVWTVLPNDGSTFSPDPGTTAGGGISTVTFTPAAATNYTITATFDPSINVPQSIEFPLEVTPLPGLLEPANGDGTRAGAGAQIPVSVVYTVGGLPVADAEISWFISGGDATVTSPSTTDAEGIAGATVTLGSEPGSVAVGAFVTNDQGVSTFLFIDFATSYQLEILQPLGGSGSFVAGDQITIEIALRDSDGIGLEGETLDLSADIPGVPTTLVTGPNGIASTTFSAPTDPGSYTVQVVFNEILFGLKGSITDISPVVIDITIDVLAAVPQLTVNKAASLSADANGNGLADAGDIIAYDVAVSNTGNATINGIVVTDVLQGGPSTVLSCGLGKGVGFSLAPGDSIDCFANPYEVTQADVDSGQPVTNTVTASGMDALGTQVNASDTAQVPVATVLKTLVKPATGSGDGQSALPGATLGAPLTVQALDGTQAAPAVGIAWSVTPSDAATITPNPSTTGQDGLSSVNVTFAPSATPGTVSVVANRADFPAATQTFNLTVAEPPVIEPPPTADEVLVVVSGNDQVRLAGTAADPLVVRYLVGGQNAAGVSVSWSVTGDATPTSGTSTTNAEGLASFDLTLGDAPGPVTVVARAGQQSVTFTLTAIEASLFVVSGDNQVGPIETLIDEPLVVGLSAPGASELAPQEIRWSIVAGDASLLEVSAGKALNASSITDAQGRARINVRFGTTPGPVMVQAASDLTDVVVTFNLRSEVPTPRGIRGDNQVGEVGQTLAEDLVVTVAPEILKALGGVTVSWEVIAGAGTVAQATTPTDANGEASNQLTLGPEPGVNQVRATVGGVASFVFTATGVQVSGVLTKVAGDNQFALPTNTDSAPLVVRLTRADSAEPLAGLTIQWEGNNAGFVVEGASQLAGETTSVTDANGEARIVARVIASGPATVTASSDVVTASPVEFSLRGLIANTPNLDDPERGVSEVIDDACQALAALPNRNSAQEDLFQRCRELQLNAGENPDEVNQALGEMEPDVGSTLNDISNGVISNQITNVSSYLIDARRNQTGGGQFKIGLWTPTGTLPLSFLPAALAGDEESAEGRDLGADFSRLGFFASGTIGRGKYRNGQRTPDYDYRSGHLTAGVDYRFRDNLIGGVALGFTRSDLDLRNDRGSVDTRGWNLLGYGTWFNERQWYLDGVLSWGRNDYDLTRHLDYTITAVDGGRTVVEQIATASTSGDQLAASVSLGRDWQKGPWSLNAYLRGNYLRTEYDAYSERMIANRPGLGLALSVDSRTLTSRRSTLGGRATYVMSRDWGILMPHASVEWDHEFQDDPSRLVARFTADPTGARLVQIGDDVDANYFNVGVGVAALWPGGRSAFVTYERLVNAARISQGLLTAGLRIEF